jgi:hypothetical protein
VETLIFLIVLGLTNIHKADSDSYRYLTTLDATNSAVSGSLPRSLAAATGLQTLSLADPTSTFGISGTLPTEYGVFSDLSFALLSNLKSIEGKLPTEFGNWKSISTLNIVLNRGLNGTIPTEWGQMTNLNSLSVQATSLSGTIPSELSKCSMLERLLIAETYMTGTMPSEICLLTEVGRLSEIEANCAPSPGTYGNIQIDCECCNVCYPPRSKS